MKFAAVFTLKTTNLTLIGYYPHYVNSSPLTENNTVSFLRKRNKNAGFVFAVEICDFSVFHVHFLQF